MSSKFFVISAPSGTGKTTVVSRLLQKLPQLIRSISVTTRPPRPGEKSGVDYHFVDRETFEKKVERNEFFEWQEVHGSRYGTSRASLEAAQQGEKDLILDIDTRGARAVKKAYPDSCLIFLKPPSEVVLEQRLRARKTEGGELLQIRLKAAEREMAEQSFFDYVIINDNLEKALQEVQEVIQRERKRAP